jgi:ADP-ribosylglycohydrolase
MRPLSSSSRARGALLGLLVPSAAPVPERPSGFEAPTAEVIGEPALALLLAEELLQPEIDLRRLAHAWADWAAHDGRGLDEGTRSALHHIRVHDSPPSGSPHEAGAGPMVRCIPVGLAMTHSPASLVSGSYHLVRLTHAEEACAWATVAVNITVARFLAGGRDFIPDVIEALRNNGAPEPLLAATRRVPLEQRKDLPLTPGKEQTPAEAMEVALWLAYREPNLGRALDWLDDAAVDAGTAALVGALLGARDGEQALPAERIAAMPEVERTRSLADRLAGKSQS